MRKQLLIVVLICNVIPPIFLQENQCMFQDTCERCLGAAIECAWCTDKKYDIRYRCLTQAQLIEFGCNQNDIYVNEPELHKLDDAPLKDYETVYDKAVQVKPQRLYVKLVKSHPQQIKLSYRPARSNPLDLYILMDLTWTMRDDKETLVKLGVELAESLRNLTGNYRLGFGSFADKPTMPMIFPQLGDNPCAPEQKVCEPTYGFKHHLRLTDDAQDFVNSVNSSQITGNVDNLEGGMDALMQVIVCSHEIGWKEEARKVVILVTDAYMQHFAGDGKLAGITKLNDKKCHLNAAGLYTGSLEYDYPSLEEIYRELSKSKINVIFAVTADVVATYRRLSELMKEISNVEILSADSSNILELIKKSYETIIKRTQFTDNSPDFIKTEFETNCGGQYKRMRKRNFCENLELGKQVEFYINLTLLDFPQDGIYVRKIRIEESSISEFLELEVEIQKPCPCDEKHEPNHEYGQLQCSYNGYLQCGMCNCEQGWTGTYCSCSTDNTYANTTVLIENMCREPSKTNASDLGLICSNRGECDCGICFCFPGYSGKYCECLDCDEECNPERADCMCGRCVCKPGWSGDKCDCTDSVESCVGPSGEECSERGQCYCGQCDCDEPFKGKFCEVGSETENKLCSFYEPCVRCLIEEKNEIKPCKDFNTLCSSAEKNERFSYAFIDEQIASDAELRCLARVQNQHGIKCDHYFTYKSMGRSENYLLIEAKTCEPVDYVAFIGFGALATFLLGLLLICVIMYCVRLNDAREYARFENEHKNYPPSFGNPIYRNPITTYVVPTDPNEKVNVMQ